MYTINGSVLLFQWEKTVLPVYNQWRLVEGGRANRTGWNGIVERSQTCGFHMFDVVDTVPLTPFQPVQ